MIVVSHKNQLLALTQRLILLDKGRVVLDKRDEVIRQLTKPIVQKQAEVKS